MLKVLFLATCCISGVFSQWVLSEGNCTASQFACHDNFNTCVPAALLCDGYRHCYDGTDEINCDKCTDPVWTFYCKQTRKCVSSFNVCDGSNDCGDAGMGSDETNCPACTADQYRCATGKCVMSSAPCNGLWDCPFGSDEHNCTKCTPDAFLCKATNTCLPLESMCDGLKDCSDESDEQDDNCKSVACRDYQIRCTNNGRCVYGEHCNGIQDCEDNSDETNCRTQDQTPVWATCHSNEFPCMDGGCIPEEQRCDGVSQCVDGIDEMKCDKCNGDDAVFCISDRRCLLRWSFCHGWASCEGLSRADCKCEADEYQCANGQCAFPSLNNFNASNPGAAHCNGMFDCYDESDEANCTTCSNYAFKCKALYANATCISRFAVCDGFQDCVDNSDEAPGVCAKHKCDPLTDFQCVNGQCMTLATRCDGYESCRDGSDERDCI